MTTSTGCRADGLPIARSGASDSRGRPSSSCARDAPSAHTLGFLLGPLNWLERCVAIGSASFLVVAVPLTDEIGLAAVTLFLVWHVWRKRQRAAQPA